MLTDLSYLNEQSLQKNCKGEYINVDTKNVLCSRNIETFNEVFIFFFSLCSFFPCKFSLLEFLVKQAIIKSTIVPLPQVTSGLSMVNILDPSCDWLDTETSWRRSLLKKYPRKNFLNTHLKLPSLNCRVIFMPYWIINIYSMLLFCIFLQRHSNYIMHAFVVSYTIYKLTIQSSHSWICSRILHLYVNLMFISFPQLELCILPLRLLGQWW